MHSYIYFQNLELKGKPFKVSKPATLDDIDQLYGVLSHIDPTLQRTDTTAKDLKDKRVLHQFMDHCCVSRKYFFLIRKCGQPGCSLCRPPRLAPDDFQLLKQFPGEFDIRSTGW